MMMIVTIMVMMVMNIKRRMIKNGRDCLLVLTPVGDDYMMIMVTIMVMMIMKMMNRNKEDDLKWSRLPPSVCRRINRPFCIHQHAESAKYSLTSPQMRMMWTILVTSTDFDLTFL